MEGKSGRSGTDESVYKQKFRQFSITDDGLAWLLLASLMVYIGLSGTGTWGFSFADVNPAVSACT